jgi:DNA mismatch endonuclease (patch repair protein)
VPCRVDILFPRRRIAVFVDGCFWHGCPEHYNTPRTNAGYWARKIARNISRDRQADDLLTGAGWSVLRFWEHDSPERCAALVAAAVRRGAGAVPVRPPP